MIVYDTWLGQSHLTGNVVLDEGTQQPIGFVHWDKRPASSSRIITAGSLSREEEARFWTDVAKARRP